MNLWKFSLMAALLALGLSGIFASVSAQASLEELVEQSEEEEAELERVPGAEIPGLGEESITGRVRLPSGEEVERLRITQDREIDPKTYIVGPGDILQLYIWGEFDLSYLLQVDPEGSVLIPTIDVFHVGDLSLAAAKRLILGAAQSKYPGVETTIVLSSMRFFTVYVTGAVLTEGSMTVQPTTRVSDLIKRAGGYLDELQGTSIEEEVTGKKVTRVRQIFNRPVGRRSISLIHRDGSVENVDLEMFHSTGHVEFNPYVRMGDVVHVGFRRDEIYIHGEVNQAGTYEYLPTDTVGDLVDLAKGRRAEVPLQKVEIWRFKENSEETEVIVLGDNADPERQFTFEEVADFPVKPKDMIFIRGLLNWQRVPTAWVSGEVNYRGRYRVVPEQTRLLDLIEEAGGLTEEASLIGAKVIRTKQRNLLELELERLQKLQEVSGLADMSPEDKAYLKTKGREERGRATVDFERLFNENDETQNIFLENGDVVYIPLKRRTVSVSGQVAKPGLIDFEEGRRVAFYLDQAGGYSYGVNKGGARLIRARTGVREKLDKNAIVEAGDEIWVPEKEYRDWWAFFQGTMRTVAETLTLVILIRTL